MIKTLILALFTTVASAQVMQQGIIHGTMPSGTTVTYEGGFTFQWGTDGGNQKIAFGTPFVTGTVAPGTQNCTVWVGDATSHTIDCGIYSTSSGQPSNLLCHVTRTGTWTANAFNVVGVISGCGLSANTLYDMASISSSNLGTEQGNNGTANQNCPNAYYAGARIRSVYGTTQTNPVLPATFGTVNAYNSCISQYVDLTCSGSCGTTPNSYALITPSATSGTAISTSTLATDTKCSDGGWTVTQSSSTYSNTQSTTYHTTQNVCGSAYTGSTGVSIKRTAGATDVWKYTPNSQWGTAITLAYFIYQTGSTQGTGDACDQAEAGGFANQITPQFQYDTRIYMDLETTPITGTAGNIPTPQNAWYWVNAHAVSSGNNTMTVVETGGFTSLGSITSASQGAIWNASGAGVVFSEGNEGSCNPDAGTIYYGPWIVDAAGTSTTISADLVLPELREHPNDPEWASLVMQQHGMCSTGLCKAVTDQDLRQVENW